MASKNFKEISDYFLKVSSASKELTKKELFKDLLNRLYSDSDEIKDIIDAISLGAEKTILNIPRHDSIHYGSADTLYNEIIIEFENDLSRTLAHAKEQLAGYLLGEYRSGRGYNFTLIASDFINWKIYSLSIEQLNELDSLQEHELELVEIKPSSFTLTESNAEDFYFWIDRFLFREQKQKATLQKIEERFGYTNYVFIDSFLELKNHFRKVRDLGEVKVAHEQWYRSLSIAYGTFDGTDEKFVTQTYLSIFSKLLAYSLLVDVEYIKEDELKAVINGSVFDRYNVSNFVENDFFHWVVNDHSFGPLKKVFRRIAQEISSFDFHDVDEDVLKGIYQELIDLDTRHSLGEYYTPDWLCDRIVNEFQFSKTDKILDPSCGSGSFLRAAVRRVRELNPDVTIEELNQQIHGIDIHPLSVQIAKTTLLLSLGKEIRNLRRPLHLNISLANTLLAPQEIQTLFNRQFKMSIDDKPYELVTDIFDDMALFNDAVSICDDLAETSQGGKNITIETLKNNLAVQTKKTEISDPVLESFYEIYKGLKKVKETGRDTIWKFIVQNNYKPYFLKSSFDYVIGNPPWFTYSNIKNEDYQDTLNLLATTYNVKPERQANYPHLEIAAIFMSFCSDHFLKENGRIAFVVPRSFFSADQHHNTRIGAAKGFCLTNIWDLFNVSPLFRIPSGVLFGKNAKNGEGIKKWRGKVFSGDLKHFNSKLSEVASRLKEVDKDWYFTQMGSSSAFSVTQSTIRLDGSPYKNLFNQGATITPRSGYFVELIQDLPKDFHDRILHVRTSKEAISGAKKPWTNIELYGKIESRFLFRTALSKSILPFLLLRPDLVVLPILLIETSNGSTQISPKTWIDLRDDGYSNASNWFREVETVWEERRTERNEAYDSVTYLNWRNKLSEQDLNAPFLVLYNASATDANATVVIRDEIDLPFIAESKEYVFETYNLEEAYYLAAVLNSDAITQQMRDFQTRGLFGFRDIHKKILDVYFPRFDSTDVRHVRISELSRDAHQKAKQFVNENPPEHELTPRHLGRLRTDIKRHLFVELERIDDIVLDIIT